MPRQPHKNSSCQEKILIANLKIENKKTIKKINLEF